MKKLLLLFSLLLFTSTTFSQEDVKALIAKIMDEQELAWNKGDIDGFMSAYWKSDSLKFIGKNGITYGWQNTLDNYKKSYPDKATMGTLDFTIISIDEVSPSTTFVVGKWHLKRDKSNKGDVGGYFTLVWRKTETRWVIVMDHTS
ncbi:MAG: nuclear transport factor 2 family protein [Bacteroidetes bacterium]|nr:nuclear transport factor 2 family protein [Bacteroidota bacterium]